MRYGGHRIIGAATACLAALAALGGCVSQYRVDVRNMADQPIHAELVWTYNENVSSARRQARIGPGDRATIGPVTVDATKRVTLVVDFQGNVGYPAEMPLDPGRSVVNVKRADEGVAGTIRLEMAPRP